MQCIHDEPDAILNVRTIFLTVRGRATLLVQRFQGMVNAVMLCNLVFVIVSLCQLYASIDTTWLKFQFLLFASMCVAKIDCISSRNGRTLFPFLCE
jgi:hypothetical protein